MKRLGLIALVLVVGWFGWRHVTSGGDETESIEAQKENPSLILDRVWIDSEPKTAKDYVNAFIAISQAPIGAFQKASAYQVELEIFEFERNGNKIDLVFPQTDTKKRFRYKVESCNDLPPFDLCLRLNKNPWHKGPKTYYSMRDGHGNARLRQLRHKLLHSVESHPGATR
jgi:hypothetical protein